MKRREFLSLAAAATTFPRVTLAQAKVPRVALVSPGVPPSAMVTGGDANYAAILDQMAKAGFVEGKTVIYERYLIPVAKTEEIAKAVVASKPDVIFWGGASAGALIGLQIDRTTPMVIFVTDIGAVGVVKNLAHPEANITGISGASPDVSGKRLGILCEAVPTAKTIAYLTGGTADKVPPTTQVHLDAAIAAAARLGVSVVPVVVESPGSEDLVTRAIERVKALGCDAIQIGSEVTVQFWSELEARLCIAAKLPGISQYDQFAPAGGLITYGASQVQGSRQSADYLALILKGARPGDLPVQLTTVYNFVVNLKTAAAIGIMVPQATLLQATQVIE